MPFDLHRYINAIWTLVGIYWAAASIGSKKAIRREHILSRVLHLAVFGTVLYLLLGSPRIEALRLRFIPNLVWIAWIGLGLMFAGAAIAIWARAMLGSNWSGSVTLKRDHALIRRGPYALARHPIYSGLLLAIVGNAVALGEVRGLLAFALAFIGWATKAAKEERFLMDQFNGDYVRYRAEVKRLIPFVY